MICRITSGANFHGVLGYACKKSKRPELIYSTVDSVKLGDVAKEFSERAKLSSKCKKPVSHYVLSLADGERLDANRWGRVVEAVMESCGADQCHAVRHRDTGHDHVHIILNRVTVTGRAWRTSNERHRMRALCIKIEKESGLEGTAVRSVAVNIGKDELEMATRLCREGKADSPVPQRLIVIAMVDSAYASCTGVSGFIKKLATEGIDVQLCRDKAGAAVGVKFVKGRISVLGSACDIDVGLILSGMESKSLPKNQNLLNYKKPAYHHVR